MHQARPYHPRWQLYFAVCGGVVAGSLALLYTLDKSNLLPVKLSALFRSPFKHPSKDRASAVSNNEENSSNAYTALSSRFKQLENEKPERGYYTLSGEGYREFLSGRNDLFFQHTLIDEAKQVVYNGFFVDPDKRTMHSVVTFGDKVCGHSGIVHGGLIAACFDEFFGALVITSVQPNVFTANLNINYRKPLPADSAYIWRGQIDEVLLDRRKITVSGRLEGGDGQVYAEGTALFVISRQGAALSKLKTGLAALQRVGE